MKVNKNKRKKMKDKEKMETKVKIKDLSNKARKNQSNRKLLRRIINKEMNKMNYKNP